MFWRISGKNRIRSDISNNVPYETQNIFAGMAGWFREQYESAGNFFSKDKYGNRWNWETDGEQAMRYELQDSVLKAANATELADIACSQSEADRFRYNKLFGTLAKKAAEKLGIDLFDTNKVTDSPDSLVQEFLQSKLDPNDPKSPMYARMQAVLNYKDGPGSWNRSTSVSGVKFQLIENDATKVYDFFRLKDRLFLNVATAANEVGITGVTVSSIYRGSGSHDGRSMDITYVNYNDANDKPDGSIYKRTYDPETQTYGTPTQPDIIKRFEAAFMSKPDSAGIKSPWTNWYKPNARQDSLLDTYGWMGDRKPFLKGRNKGSYYGSNDWSNNPASGELYDQLIILHPELKTPLDHAQQHYHHGHFQLQ